MNIAYPVLAFCAWWLFGKDNEGPEMVFTLDRHCPPPFRDTTLQSLVYDNSPDSLDVKAHGAQVSGYPLCALELQKKANALRIASPYRSNPCAAIDGSLDARTCASVMNALATSRNSSDLRGFADSISAKFPKASAALKSKADELDKAQASISQATGKGVITDQTPFKDLEQSAGKGVITDQIHLNDLEQSGAKPERPKGNPYVIIRDSDKIWPDKFAAIASGDKNSHLTLYGLNPHLTGTDGTISKFKTGDEVNVDKAWVDRLRKHRAGFQVHDDQE